LILKNGFEEDKNTPKIENYRRKYAINKNAHI